MLHPAHILSALQEKTGEFARFAEHEQEEKASHRQLLTRFEGLGVEEILHKIQHEAAGALPTEEFRDYGLCVPFVERFENHQQARRWARGILEKHTTFAVDGSQLMPSKELSVPVAVVQAGSFLNPHEAGGSFAKKVQTEVLGPEELLASGSEDKLYHEQMISLRRYELETQMLRSFFAQRPRSANRPLAFFDGSLLISFAEVLMEFYRQRYLQAATGLLCDSQTFGCPLIGYVDTSVARDLIRMLRKLFFDDAELQQDGLRDNTLVDALLPCWGDRTIAFRLARPGILSQYDDAGGGIGFVYMRTQMKRPPARIEFPMWLVDAGLLEASLNLVRAEAVVGNGYPYSLETADQTAWFSPADRSRFVRLLRAFLERNELDLRVSGKLQSKQRRR